MHGSHKELLLTIEMPAGSVRELKLGRQQYLDCGYNGELLGCDWQSSVMVPAASNSDISCHKNKLK